MSPGWSDPPTASSQYLYIRAVLLVDVPPCRTTLVTVPQQYCEGNRGQSETNDPGSFKCSACFCFSFTDPTVKMKLTCCAWKLPGPLLLFMQLFYQGWNWSYTWRHKMAALRKQQWWNVTEYTFEVLFPFSASLYFHSTSFWRQTLYFFF